MSNDNPIDEKPSVSITKDGFFEFYLGTRMVYDLQATSSEDVVRWVELLSEKQWITKEHLNQFAALSVRKFDIPSYQVRYAD